MTLEERPSVCTFDCPDTCSLTVTVEDEHIVKVRGSEAMPFTDGVVCNKIAQGMGTFVHGPQRLLYPLRRTGPKGAGELERISWDAALEVGYLVAQDWSLTASYTDQTLIGPAVNTMLGRTFSVAVQHRWER